MNKLLLTLLLAASLCACRQNSLRQTSMTEPTAAANARPGASGGLALYTLRDTMAANPRAVLKHVADLGYAYIESAGYDNGKFYSMTPTEFKDYLASVGLTPVSSHMGMVTLDNVDQLVRDVKAAGFDYFVIPVPPMGAFHYDGATQTMSMQQDAATVLRNLNAIADKCAAAGLMCLYHNHDFEFRADAQGIVPIDYFLENSDPDKLNFQMDLFWVTKAGADPVAYFNRYPGRFHAWHVKDMDQQGRFAPVGRGTMDFQRILAAKEKSGMRFYLVEQDLTFDETPLEAIAISKGGLKAIGFK